MFAQFKLYIIGGILVAFLALGLYAKYLKGRNDSLQYTVAELNSKINDQNGAILLFKKNSEERLKAAQVALVVAQTIAANAKAKSVVVYKTAPSTPGNACKSALDLVNTQ